MTNNQKESLFDTQHIAVYIALFSAIASGFTCLYVWKLDKDTFETYRVEQRQDFKEVKSILTATREDLIQIKTKLKIGNSSEK